MLAAKAQELDRTIRKLSAMRDGLRHAAACPRAEPHGMPDVPPAAASRGVWRHSHAQEKHSLKTIAQGARMKLVEALPDLVLDMESPLLQLGRGDLVQQLKEALLRRWTYDDFSDTTYLYLSAEPVERMQVERLSLYDEVGVNLDADEHGRLCGIEVLDGKRIATQLQQ